MRPPTKLEADEKHGSQAQMLRIVSEIEAYIRKGKVRALSVVFIDNEGLALHDQSYSTEDGSVDWLALAATHDIAKQFIVGDVVRAELDE